VICRIVLGPGHALVTLAVASAVSVAILSLLIGDNGRAPHGLGANVMSPPQP
jgi:hypothetical protein